MKTKHTLLAALLALTVSNVQANILTTEVNILDTDPGSVQYVNFDVLSAGTFDISALGEETYGPDYNFDPQIYLFAGGLDLNNLIADNDDNDNGLTLDSLIAGISLDIGSYTLAVSEFFLSADEAVSGLNADSINDPGLLQIVIDSQDGGEAQLKTVPTPPASLLLGAGLLGFMGMRKKNTQ
jgi:hypothetical protein